MRTHPAPSIERQTIEQRTKDNPFFIEEVLQSLIESGHLWGVPGAYRLTAPVETLDVPASVQADIDPLIPLHARSDS
jgi:predicted ATPase